MSLTTKEEIFVQCLVEKKTQREAYKFAYNCKNMKNETIDSKASILFKKEKIRARYDELMNELKERSFYTIEKANEELEWFKSTVKEDIKCRGLRQANANAYLGAIKQQIDLNGIAIKEAKEDIDNTFKIQLVGAFDE